MSNNKVFKDNSYLFSLNAVFVEEMYQKFLENPQSVDESWREFFIVNQGGDTKVTGSTSWKKQDKKIIGVSHETSIDPKAKKKELPLRADDLGVRVDLMIDAYRSKGHFLADIDPIGLESKISSEQEGLSLSSFGLSEGDLDKEVTLGCGSSGKVSDFYNFLHRTYCGKVAYEFMYIDNKEERDWLSDRIESFGESQEITAEERVEKLKTLLKVESFEQFLQTRFPGVKRFSIEGGEASIIAARKAIKTSAELDVSDVVLGMPHRGRLSMLTKILNKPYPAMLSEFQGNYAHPENLDISGDVKYHLGMSTDVEFRGGKKAHLSLVANPSHLEAVNPVVMGKVRAVQDQNSDVERKQAMAVLMHGDASFAGQGVVMESLVLSDLDGYAIGGVVHIVVNNQVGFTACHKEACKGRYSTDVAKSIHAPIFHVNGNDAMAVLKASKIAAEFRNKFKKDVVLDIVCYRLHGHNEIDEPNFTQPLMYQKISSLKTPGGEFCEQLVREGLVEDGFYDRFREEFKQELDKELEASKTFKQDKEDWFEGRWKDLKPFKKGDIKDKNTGISESDIKSLGQKITFIPNDFTPHKTVEKVYKTREENIKTGKGIDWATAESLAFAGLVNEGFKVRLSGQDCKRGTFSQRHCVMTDQKDASQYCSLNSIKPEGGFEVINSALSEYAVLGFEYGYSMSDPNSLVLWEAQFGDFSNGAQIIIDQFISSAEEKWMRVSGLVMLLPHAYEGQGPEHSSARLERYLQLCGQNNMQVVNCTTPANYFHVLRRQMHRDYRKPLIIVTPKSLLRHKLAVSDLKDFTEESNGFKKIIDDVLVDKKQVKKLVLCSGKVYYDLLEARDSQKRRDVALVRIEQYYPFPQHELIEILKQYSAATEVIWCQEEPKNQGAWFYIRAYLELCLSEAKSKSHVKYVGRPEAASTAAGYAKMHKTEQEKLIKEALS